MATIWQYLTPEAAVFKTSAFPAYVINQGTTFPVSGLAFDSSTPETAFWKWSPLGYVTDFRVDVVWYADTATASSQGVEWSAGVAAITPNTDTSTNTETKAMIDGGGYSTDLGSGATAHKLKVTQMVLGAWGDTDSMADGDEVWLRLTRVATTGADDLVGDAIVTSVRISYSDT